MLPLPSGSLLPTAQKSNPWAASGVCCAATQMYIAEQCRTGWVDCFAVLTAKLRRSATQACIAEQCSTGWLDCSAVLRGTVAKALSDPDMYGGTV